MVDLSLGAGRNVSSPIFVGRENERASIQLLLDVARAGDSGLVLISGEAGVGKSRLVGEATRLATDCGMRVLVGHCVLLGAEGIPFAPLVEALRGLSRSVPRDVLDEILGPAQPLMARLLPRFEAAPELLGPAEQASQLLAL